jgi:hypothetical protein
MYLNHNNCLPCFKGGKGHFISVARYYPEYFAKAVKAEEESGHTVFKDCTLKDLQKQADAMDAQMVIEEAFNPPCMCSF